MSTGMPKIIKSIKSIKFIKYVKKHRYALILMLILFSVFLSILDLYYAGNTKIISLGNIFNFIINGTTGNKFKDFILLDIRVPRILGAIIIGLTLSACGLMLQTLFRNLLASPYTTGISSGVLLVVALVIFIDSFSKIFGIFGTNKILVAGWMGGLFSMIMLIIIALRVKEVNGIIIVALLLSYLFEGIRSYLIANAANLQIQEYWEFTIGTLSKLNLKDIHIMMICTIIFIISTAFLIKPLNALLFGEKYAKSFGLNIKKIRVIILMVSSFITGAIIPYVGLIAFVGIASPYLARPLIKTSDHKYLLPTSMLIGVILMLLCNLLSLKYYLPIHIVLNTSKPAPPLPIGSVMDVIGGLLVIYIVYKSDKKMRYI